MRNVVCVCRSKGKSRNYVAATLDQFLPRIGDRTWKGRASNACIDRMTRELRSRATRSTSVTLHEGKSDATAQRPLVTIGSHIRFSEDGLSPVHDHNASTGKKGADPIRAILGITALFHDMGKASVMFQDKLERSLAGSQDGADRLRHELISALIWDELAGDCCDNDLAQRLINLTPTQISEAWTARKGQMRQIALCEKSNVDLNFCADPKSMTFLIGMLILSHHRLPLTSHDFLSVHAALHINEEAILTQKSFDVAPGAPFWEEAWFSKHLSRMARSLISAPQGLEQELRDAVMIADHHGSANSEINGPFGVATDVHLANTRNGRAADSLSLHTRKVFEATARSCQVMFSYRENWPALMIDQLPLSLRYPDTRHPNYGWQGLAAEKAREVASNGGGFFSAILSGTGSGKTRGAPSILAAAASADPDVRRRALRMTLGLGLRTLASQSAREYVEDMELPPEDISLFVSRVPLRFSADDDAGEREGRESLIDVPEWLAMEQAGYSVPDYGSTREPAWLSGLSVDTSRMMPAWAEIIARESRNSKGFQDLLRTPIAVGTVDHIMAAASAERGRHLPQSLRVTTSDLILDEIDQYGDEDLATLTRLVRRSGAAGRRVIIMSATLPPDLAETLFTAYRSGWLAYSSKSGAPSNVAALICGDDRDAIFGDPDVTDISDQLSSCRAVMAKALEKAPTCRIGKISDEINTWEDVLHVVDQGASDLHDKHHSKIGKHRISVGAVRFTRMRHASALAAQLPSGRLADTRMRLKLCLHSNLPRAQREWIERSLARVLNRKSKDHEERLIQFLEELGVMEEFRNSNCEDLEIVVICTPVIETGNDIDLDWGILDMISMRSLIQFAGRIQRHRRESIEHPNLLVLSRPLIDLSEGSLSQPGVETPFHEDTAVPKMDLGLPRSREISTLAGPAVEGAVNAEPFLIDRDDLPLLRAEQVIRTAVLGDRSVTSLDDTPLARFSYLPCKMRKFRRDNRRNIALTLRNDGHGMEEWNVDLAPGTRHSAPRPAHAQGVTFSDMSDDGWLVPDILDRARDNLEGSPALPRISAVEISDPSRGEVLGKLHFDAMTGAIAGVEEDLFSPFGRPQGKDGPA